MKKNLGIFLILLAICVVTGIIDPKFMGVVNLQNTIRWSGLYGIMAIGVSFVIITGGIDLSIGSVIGLVGCLLPFLLKNGIPLLTSILLKIHFLAEDSWLLPYFQHPPLVIVLCLVMVLAATIGLLHGVLITKLRLQPFVVTLCGLLFYRGISRYFTGDATQGFGSSCAGMKTFIKDNIIHYFTGITPAFDIPMVFVLMIIIGIIAAFFLNRTIWGRYLLALGRNEQAAKFSGIQTDRIIILSYVICATMAGLAGIFFVVDVNSADPSGFGNSYELYAIAGAVLGGCSLRGGEGSILGVIIGSALLRVLYNSINILGIPTQLEFAVIGVVILLGVMADEIVRRIAAKRAAIARAKAAMA